MLTDDARKTWALQQVKMYAGQIQSREPNFAIPFSDDELANMQLDDLSRLVSDLRRMANVPPSR